MPEAPMLSIWQVVWTRQGCCSVDCDFYSERGSMWGMPCVLGLAGDSNPGKCKNHESVHRVIYPVKGACPGPGKHELLFRPMKRRSRAY